MTYCHGKFPQGGLGQCLQLHLELSPIAKFSDKHCYISHWRALCPSLQRNYKSTHFESQTYSTRTLVLGFGIL